MIRGSPLRGFSAAILLLVLASCGGEEPQPPAATATPTTEAPAEETVITTVTAATPTTTLPPPPPVRDLPLVPEAFRERLVALVEETQRLRGLGFAEPLSIETVTSQEMSRRQRAGVEENLELSQVNARLFNLLGVMAADTDWIGLLAEVRARPTPGLYDVSSRTLWLLSTLESPSPLEEMTLVGEIAKALVDQSLGIWERLDRLAGAGQGDSLTVLSAMAEADSTLVELLFAAGMTPDDQQLITEQAWAWSAEGPALPSFMEESLRLASGPALDYLQRLYQQGGWELVNDGHRRPPDSTEQILVLEEDPPEPVLLPRPPVSPPEGFREIADSVWGQWGWNTLLSTILDSGQAASASWGWGGDRYLLFANDRDVALVVDYVGDTPDDTREMRAALEEFIAGGMDVGATRPEDHGLEYYDQHYAWLSGGPAQEMITFIAATDVELGRQLRAYRFG